MIEKKVFKMVEKKLDNEGLHVESLARISSLDNNKVTFVD